MSPLILLACAGSTDDTALPVEDTADTAAPAPLAGPWDEDGFWTEPGPLADLLTADPDATDRTFTVRMSRSPDGIEWEDSDTVVISDFNSLDLFISDDGVILTGLVASTDVFLQMGSVYAVASADLETWSTHEWPIQDRAEQNLVDPSMHVRWDGSLGLSYYATSVFGMDPVDVPGPHDIRRAAWNGEAFVEDEAVAWADDYLVDPVICQLGGREWLFATQDATHVVAAAGDGAGTFTTAKDVTWSDHTVPYCSPYGDALGVYAQDIGTDGLPDRARFDGTTLTKEGPVYTEQRWGMNNCSSIVVAPFRDDWLLFCAVDMASYRRWKGKQE